MEGDSCEVLLKPLSTGLGLWLAEEGDLHGWSLDGWAGSHEDLPVRCALVT